MNSDARGPRIAAKSFFRQLQSQGYNRDQIITVLSELLELIIHSIHDKKHESPK